MAEPAGRTVHILREIRDAIHQTNARLDETRTELSGRLGKVEETLLELAN